VEGDPLSYEAEAGNFSVALVGDLMMNRRVHGFREPAFTALLDILRTADVGVANLETQINEFELSWAQKPDSISWQVGSPECLDDLKWMGIRAVTTSNNHSYDYNEAGLLATMRHLKARGLPCAGGGMTLDDARAPALIDLPRGRVALFGATTTFNELSAAGLARPDFPGRPGINALHHEKVHMVPRRVFDSLVEAKVELGYKEFEEVHRTFHPHRVERYDEATEVRFLGQKFRLADGYDTRTSCNRADLDGIKKWIRGATKQADWLIYSTHCHESGNTGELHEVHRPTPPEFLIEFAHWTIDQGCHAFTAHGPHILRGIEIYKGRPIFYSLGNFIFNNDTVQRQPDPAYRRQGLGHEHTPGDWGAARSGDDTYGFPVDRMFFESVAAVCTYANRQLAEIRLFPVDLGFGRPMSQRGRPMLADRKLANEILEGLRRLSEPFGTRIQVENGVGVIKVAG
jgi:poly-gamma-glutamate capsule biosynthesis protein CapA/YwtB (metallophosphatase superfamily)